MLFNALQIKRSDTQNILDLILIHFNLYIFVFILYAPSTIGLVQEHLVSHLLSTKQQLATVQVSTQSPISFKISIVLLYCVVVKILSLSLSLTRIFG